MNLIRNYLKSEEISYITYSVLEKETITEREYLKVSMIAQLLIDEPTYFSDCETCNDIFDKVFAIKEDYDLIKSVRGYDLIGELVTEELSVANQVKKLLDKIDIDNIDKNLSKSIKAITKEIKGMKIKETVSDIINKIKDSENFNGNIQSDK